MSWSAILLILSQSMVFLVFTWRHGGHVGVQNKSEKKGGKSLLGI